MLVALYPSLRGGLGHKCHRQCVKQRATGKAGMGNESIWTAQLTVISSKPMGKPRSMLGRPMCHMAFSICKRQ